MTTSVINAYAFVPSAFWIPEPSSLPVTLQMFVVDPSAEIDWGDGTTGVANFATTKTFSINSTGIRFSDPSLPVTLDCGPSSAPLRGSIDISGLSNLETFVCANQGITEILGYRTCLKLSSLSFFNNAVSGQLPSLQPLSSLTTFRCQQNQLTGALPQFNNNTQLKFLNCSFNSFDGPLPALPTGIKFAYFQNNLLSGSIPSLNTYTALEGYYVHANQLSGSLPNLSANTSLRDFFCFNNSLTSFPGGSISATCANFQAQNNLLSSTAVNLILEAFVAANRTTGTRILYLDGTGNAAPTGPGITNKQILVGRGWDVRTN